MSWLIRLLDHLLGRFRAADGAAADPKWVEPSNAITRAILNGNIGELLATGNAAVSSPVVAASAPMVEHPAPASAPLTGEPEEAISRPAAAIVTRTAQRARRRRATRAA